MTREEVEEELQKKIEQADLGPHNRKIEQCHCHNRGHFSHKLSIIRQYQRLFDHFAQNVYTTNVYIYI